MISLMLRIARCKYFGSGFLIFIMISMLGVAGSIRSVSRTNVLPFDAGSDTPSISQSYGQLPLCFEVNAGQIDPQVKFFTRGSNHALFLTPTETVLALRNDERGVMNGESDRSSAFSIHHSSFATVRMKLVGANPRPQMVGLDELPGKANYFLGNDPREWRTDVATYARVQYQEVYPGVDMVYYGNHSQLEYDLIVAPGIDPQTIILSYEGVSQLKVSAEGDLVLATAGGEIRQHKPVIYQEVNGSRREIAGGYLIDEDHQVGFQVGAYDVASPLVIDPVLAYSTYLGGNDDDYGVGIAVGASGNVYVTGQTYSLKFPTETPLQPAIGDGFHPDLFVTQYNPAGTALLYSTYLGGDNSDYSNAIAVDPSGNAYVTGYTYSANFPTKAPLQAGLALAPSTDAIVAKLNPTGSVLLYSTYLGGDFEDIASSIAVDALGNAYVTGYTISTNFPTKDPLQANKVRYQDAFIAKFNPTGSALLYSTYLGGTETDVGNSIAVDPSGNAYVAGGTLSTNFPTKAPLQPALAGSSDAFVAKLNPTGSALLYSTFLGGTGAESAYGMAIDASGNAYVTGPTSSSNFPTRTPLQPALAGSSDVFLAVVNAAGSAISYSTYLGGGSADTGYSVAVDTSGNAYLTGLTRSSNFPTKSSMQPTLAGSSDAFVAGVNPTGSTLLYSTYLGGRDVESGYSITVDPSGNTYVTGYTASINFPTKGATQPGFGGRGGRGYGDVFIVRISP